MKDSKQINLDDYPAILVVEEISEILEISTKTAYNLLRKGKIRHLRLGKLYRIPKKFLIEYINSAL